MQGEKLTVNRKLTPLFKRYIKHLSVNLFSIKKLTLVGFSLVLLPLTFALLYGANQVKQLSQQGSTDIINVAQLVEANRQLSATFNKMQRFASQYSVLREAILLEHYQQQKQHLYNTLINEFSIFEDQELTRLTTELLDNIQQADRLMSENPSEKINLDKVQGEFKQLTKYIQQINLHSNELISQYAQQMKISADHVNTNMLHSLAIIPLTIVMAIVFTLLIIRPLKQLSSKIHRLEQGRFEEKITFSGAREIQEIADALELMRTRLHALELQKSSFIRHISHELKTPLAAIREGTELLYDNSVGELNADQQEVTNIIKHSVTRLQQLIEDLLDFNIVLDSTSLQDGEKVDVAKQINQSIELRKLDWQSKNLQINTHLQNITLRTNAKQLSVVLDNLLSNAIKYSPNEGHITINAKTLNEQCIIEVCDQGPGIALELQEKIFDAFYQGPAPQESTIKSSGLGLTIVKELLMRLNANITIGNNPIENTIDNPIDNNADNHAENEETAKGLRATLYFPLNRHGENV